MNKLFIKILFVAALIVSSQIFAQNQPNVNALMQLSDTFNAKWEKAHQRVVEYANENNLEVRRETSNGRLIELVDVRDGEPVFFITDNLGAGKTTRVSELWVGGSTGLDYTGEGYSQLGEWDGGHVLKTHQEFMNTGTTRVTPMDGNYSTHYHATHVAGTMVAAGVVPGAKGALYGGNLKYWQWSSDDSEMAAAAAAGLEVSNHSYGFLRGWNYDNGWDWHGNSTISDVEDYKFGFYDYDAKGWDNIAHNAPNYLIVKSAGNDRGEGPSNGEHENDGGDDGYDCIGTRGIAKNILTVGAVYEVLDYEGAHSIKMSDFSSWGPADDGRIKPDIVGKGVNVYSTYDGNNTDYASSNGTSMSAPNVSGSLAMLQYHYQQTHGDTPMRSATLKALALHTADEAGDYPGPDYIYGWGLMNAERAARLITDDMGQNVIDEQVLNSGDTYTREVNVLAGEKFTVTICWTDVPGNPVGASLDPIDPMLINDLDLKITDASSNSFFPWKCDRDNPAAAATNNSKNAVDNVEKIEVMNAEAGTYTIIVNHDGSLTGGSQAFSIIISGIDNYTVAPECSANLVSPVDGGTDAFLNHNITWSPAPYASSYDVYFGTDGGGTTTPTNIFNGENFASNSFSFFMNENTTYYVQVVPKNSQGTASGCNDIWSFTTMEAISVFPYVQGMEDVSVPELPEFWQSYNNSSLKWLSTNLISHSGSKAMACYFDGGLVENVYDNWFVSPPFAVVEGNEYNASFFYKGFIPGHSESMDVYWGYGPDVDDLTNVIMENDNITEANWAEVDHLIVPNADGVVFIGFHLKSPTGYGAFLDDVEFEDWGFVGIEDAAKVKDPKIYISGQNIVVSTDEIWNGANINVISLVGQSVISAKHNTQSNINISSLGTGVYLVRVQKDTNVFTKKLILR